LASLRVAFQYGSPILSAGSIGSYRNRQGWATLARMKVLVGVDGSSNSLATVAFVGRLLSAEGNELLLAYVAPPLPYLGDEQLDPGVSSRAQMALANAVFDEAVMRLPDEWQSQVKRLELAGDPATALLQAADDRSAELVAVGFHGTGLFERFLLGSVSRAVVHSARVPVLVVKTTGGPTSEKIAGTPDGSFRMLAAYDGSEFGARIVALANRLSWPEAARGWVIRVVPPMFVHQLPNWLKPVERDPDVEAMAQAWRREHDQQIEQAVGELKQFQTQLPAEFRATEPIVAQGHPAEQILAMISRQKIDLAIVGSRGVSAVERLLVGSTSARVINEAPCSVLVAR
jgi:nucleotide-binding universal stress UspA family protein